MAIINKISMGHTLYLIIKMIYIKLLFVNNRKIMTIVTKSHCNVKFSDYLDLTVIIQSLICSNIKEIIHYKLTLAWRRQKFFFNPFPCGLLKFLSSLIMKIPPLFQIIKHTKFAPAPFPITPFILPVVYELLLVIPLYSLLPPAT